MPRLPGFLFNSHKRYKEDTNCLTKWLVQTAKRLGYVLESSSLSVNDNLPRLVSGRLKGKARKEARGKHAPLKTATAASLVVEYRTIAVNEFTKLARFIAASHHCIKIPSSVLKLARSAIAIRKRCAAWFKQKTNSQNEKKDEDYHSNKTHQHFITVLEEVVQILNPLCAKDDTKSAAADGTLTSPADEAALVNPFSLLGIEEEADGNYEIYEPSSEEPVAANTPPCHDENVVYTVEKDPMDEWIALFCFFEDLGDIRAFLCETWADYRDKEIDLITASVTTNTALEIVRSLQEDLLSFHPRLDDYEKVTKVMYHLVCQCRGEDPMAMEKGDVLNLNMIDVGDFLYLPVYTTLLSFCDVIEPGNLPVYKPGHFGTYDPCQSRDSMSIREKMSEDRIILLEALPDFVLLPFLNRQEPVQYELTKELQKMAKSKEISLLLVFGMQIYVDIHHVLREQVGRGLQDVQVAGKCVAASLQERAQNSPTVKFKNWPASNEASVENLNVFIKNVILRDYIADIKQPLLSRSLPGLQIEEYYLLGRHPFLCGMMQFKLQLIFQDLGLALACAWGTIMCLSHLYEAGKHAGFLKPDSWKDMEWVMKVHDKERMFRGRVPQNTEESFKSFCLMIGVSPSYFASPSNLPSRRKKQQSTGGLKQSLKGPSFLKENSPVSVIFRDPIVHGRQLELTAERVEDLLAGIGVSPSSLQCSEPQTKLQQQWARSHKMTPLQLLVALRACLLVEQHMIRFDYVSLHMRCLGLLREINTTLHEKFVQYYGQDYIENETQLGFLVGYVLVTAAESDKVAKTLDLPLPGRSTVSVMLMSACEIIDRFITQEGHAECSKLEKDLPQQWRGS